MRTNLFLQLFLISIVFPLFAQDPNWTYIRRDNTGIGGMGHYVVTGDQFDNIWTGGYDSTEDEGSLVRIATTNAVYTNWSTYSEEYLPNGLIYDVVFDNTGIIWVATAQGITTSGDGLNWLHYDTSNTPILANEIVELDIGLTNELWLVGNNPDNPSLNGIGHFDGTTWEYFNSSNSTLPADVNFKDVVEDDSGNVWVASNQGLFKYDGTTWTQYSTANSSISSDNVLAVVMDNQNRVWSLVGEAVDIFDGTNWTQIGGEDWPLTNFNGSTMDIRGDHIIITESTYRVLIYDGTSWQGQSVNFTIQDSYIDHENNYWICGYGVVGKFDGTNWQRYTENNTGLPTNFNDDIFIDSQGRKWFANGGGGIQVFDCPKWEIYGPNNEGLFPNPQPLYTTTIGTSITEDADGDIWFTYDGTSGYAIQVPDGNYSDYDAWVIWHIENSHPYFQSAEEVDATDNGYVFIRAYNGTVFMYDKTGGVWDQFYPGYGLTRAASAMERGPNGTMYIGGYAGIDIFQNGVWTTMDLSTQDLGWISSLKFDSSNHLWVGTQTGLWKYDGANWTNWNTTNSNIAADYVTGIDIDANGIIYISAHNTSTWPYYGGISYFDGTGNTFTTFLDGESPIAHKQVEDIAVDEHGNVWALTQSEGFSIYNPNGISGFECVDRTLERTLGVQDVENSEQWVVKSYPNPFKETVTIEFESKDNRPIWIEIFDLSGKTVERLEVTQVTVGNNRVELNLSRFMTGIYLCKVSSQTASKTIKLMKK